MRASKENADIAIRIIIESLPESRETNLLLAFLKAAKRKLPSEAAYERERKRKRETTDRVFRKLLAECPSTK